MKLSKFFKKLGFGDGLRNDVLRVGSGVETPFNRNVYAPEFTSLNRQKLEWAYQSSWICALVVDLLASDMTREGVEIRTEDPAVGDRIERAFKRWRVWQQIADALKWSRLFGGSLAVILIDGADMSMPMTDVRKGSFRGLHVLDRWQVQPSEELVQTLGPDFGKPRYYDLVDGFADIQVPNKRIHHSRVIRLEGRQLPYYLRRMYLGWGGSILEPLMSKVEAFDLATQSAAQLISKAHLRYYRVKGLREILTNARARAGFLAQMEHIRRFQSTEGMTVGDVEDEFQVFQYTFAGLPELLVQFGQQISGACGIPLVRLFGQSPAGLNSTGESDFRNYYDNVRHLQELHLRPGIEKLIRVIHQSEFGCEPSADTEFEFISLWQLTSEQKAQAAQSEVGAIMQALQGGAISVPTAMQELKALSGQLGIFASISDEDIAEAVEQERMEPPAPEGFNGNETDEAARASEVPGARSDEASERLVRGEAPQAGPDGLPDRPAA